VLGSTLVLKLLCNRVFDVSRLQLFVKAVITSVLSFLTSFSFYFKTLFPFIPLYGPFIAIYFSSNFSPNPLTPQVFLSLRLSIHPFGFG